jgi:hypothetical protein
MAEEGVLVLGWAGAASFVWEKQVIVIVVRSRRRESSCLMG